MSKTSDGKPATTGAALTKRSEEPVRKNHRSLSRYFAADFGPLVVANLCEKYRVLYGTDIDEDELEFAFDWDYIKQRGGPERVSKLIAYKDIKIKGYLAPFYLRRNPDLIAPGWECGFGGANSQGFGMAGI